MEFYHVLICYITNQPHLLQHQVLPDDKLRFALTCRYIKPKEVPASEHWKGDYDANIVAEYDGDLEAFEEAYADQMGG